MNPVQIKSETEARSRVVLMGRPWKNRSNEIAGALEESLDIQLGKKIKWES
jgi:cobyric acid synthase